MAAVAAVLAMCALYARAEESSLSAAIRAAAAAVPGWVLAAERAVVQDTAVVEVLVATEKAGVQRVVVEAGGVTRQEAWGAERGRVLADDLRARCGDARPDLAELASRVEGMAEGCRVVEAEIESHGDAVVTEVECVRGAVEVELVFDPRDGRLVGLEVEEEDEDGEDEGGDEDEDDD